MPRDANGNMTLVSGNPVVADTDIVTTWANPTMSDLAAELQDSLSRSGKGGMLVPFKNLDGSINAPGVTFTNQTGTGHSRVQVSSVWGIALSISGAIKTFVSAVLARFYTPVQMDSTLDVKGTSQFEDDVVMDGQLSVTGKITATGGLDGITVADLPAVTNTKSASSGLFTAAATVTWVDVTNLALTGIVATGRPIWLVIQPYGVAQGAIYGDAAAGAGFAQFQIIRTTGGSDVVIGQGTFNVPAGTKVGVLPYISYLDTPAAGTHSYKVQVNPNTVGLTQAMVNLQLIVLQP